mgnify:CR=1 FL=1
MKTNCINKSIKIIVHHLNKISPKNIEIKIHEKKICNKILPSYDEKIIERMIKNGGI